MIPTTPSARQASLREHNLGLVARAVFGAERPPSRAGVAEATGLTRATVSTLVDQLVGARIVRELPPEAGHVGRPAVPLVPARRTVAGLGLEVNLDYLGVRAVDLAGETVAEAFEQGDFHASDPVRVLARLGVVARAVLDRLAAEGVAVAGGRLALPGLVDARARRLELAPNLGWESLDPVPLLGPLPVELEIANEANLAGLAQLRFGWFADGPAEATSAPDDLGPDDLSLGGTSFVYVSADVGVGAAIVLDGTVYVGRRGWAGEIGHVAVDPAGPVCRCGARGCLEAVAGKEAVLAALGEPSSADAAHLAARLGAADPLARAVAERAGRALGTALAAVVNLVDLDTILLGGFYADVAGALSDVVADELRVRVLVDPGRVTVATAPVTDHAALTGGARAVLRDVVGNPSGFISTVAR